MHPWFEISRVMDSAVFGVAAKKSEQVVLPIDETKDRKSPAPPSQTYLPEVRQKTRFEPESWPSQFRLLMWGCCNGSCVSHSSIDPAITKKATS